VCASFLEIYNEELCDLLLDVDPQDVEAAKAKVSAGGRAPRGDRPLSHAVQAIFIVVVDPAYTPALL
jgi:hypothetical protein